MLTKEEVTAAVKEHRGEDNLRMNTEKEDSEGIWREEQKGRTYHRTVHLQVIAVDDVDFAGMFLSVGADDGFLHRLSDVQSMRNSPEKWTGPVLHPCES